MERNYVAVLIAVTVGLSLLAVGAFAAFGSAGADQPDEGPSTNNEIYVSAVGDADAEPDQAVVNVAITAEGEELGPVRDELASGTEELTAALDDLGVEYETADYDIDQRRHPREEREMPTYLGMHAFTVTLDDPDSTGDLIDEAVDAGAVINNVRLTLSEESRQELRDEAIQAAMDDARHQADTIANASGLQVTGVSTVDASQQRFSPVSYDEARESGGDAAPPTQIETGTVSVTYAVDVTYNATSP